MDGLLIDSEPLWQTAVRDAMATVGVDISSEPQHKFQGWRLSETVEHFYDLQAWKGASQADVMALIIDDVNELIRQKGSLKPGVHEALEICKNAELNVAIASGSPVDVVNTVVDSFKLGGLFDHVYSADHEPYGKPHPGVFITTAGLLKVLPRECLVFEDAPSGVLAAKAAKMKCIAVPIPSVKDHPFIQTADIVLNSLEEFNVALLAKI